MFQDVVDTTIFILVVITVIIATLITAQIINSAVQQYKEKYLIKSVGDLEDMFIFISPRQLQMLSILSTLIFFLSGLILVNLIFAFIISAVGWIVPVFIVKHYRKRRLKKFNKQLVDALTMMSSAFRAGLTLQQAMTNIIERSPRPLSQEFNLTVQEIRLGLSVEKAMINLSERVDCEDLELLVTSLNVARQMGGNLAEIFDNISTTIGERFRIEGKIDALTAQGKMQGLIVALIPFALAVVLNYMRPDLMKPMLNHWFGWALFGVIILLELVGMFFIRKIVNIRV